MVSHDPTKESFRRSTPAEYKAFYERVEMDFSPEELSRDEIIIWLKNDELADAFALTKEVNSRINDAETVEDVRGIVPDIRLLIVHKNTLLRRAGEKINEIEIERKELKIAVSIAGIVGDFAKGRVLNLSDTLVGDVYNVWGRAKKPAVVLFKNGRLKAWRHLTEEELGDIK